MTDTEKLAVSRLLLAIEDFRKPCRFTLGLPPWRGEWDQKRAETSAIYAQRERDLDAAILATKALVALFPPGVNS